MNLILRDICKMTAVFGVLEVAVVQFYNGRVVGLIPDQQVICLHQVHGKTCSTWCLE